MKAWYIIVQIELRLLFLTNMPQMFFTLVEVVEVTCSLILFEQHQDDGRRKEGYTGHNTKLSRDSPSRSFKFWWAVFYKYKVQTLLPFKQIYCKHNED